jgi:hypothetical protein
MNEVVLSTFVFHVMALGPLSGTITKEFPPAQAIPDPRPPRIFAGCPFSRFPVNPERSDVLVKEYEVRRVGVASALEIPHPISTHERNSERWCALLMKKSETK